MKHELRSSCPIAASLDIFGDRWTLLILRDMLLGGYRHFSDFAADEGIATNVLTDRLNRLVEVGLIDKIADPEDGRRVVYLPREPAIELTPILAEIIAWGLNNTAAPTTAESGPLLVEKSRQAFVKARMAAARSVIR